MLLTSLSEPQRKISECPARFRVVAAGRRFGKSWLAIWEMCRFASQPKKRILGCAPTYKQCKNIWWEELKTQLIARNWVRKINESELQITLINGSTITLRSAENRDALRGGKYDFLVMDEVADIHPDAWYQVLRPTLSDTGGHALFIGSPKGRNYFYEMWMDCVNKTDWQAFQFTTLEGGNVPPEEIEAARRDLDERTFRQEYEANFVDYAGVIFYAYSDEHNLQRYDTTHFTPRTPLHLGIDFNVSPITAVIAVKGPDWLHVIDEIEIYGSNTLELVTEIKNRYGDQRQYYAYPDATGSRKNTNSMGVSDHIVLQNNGFKVITDKINPVVNDSIASVNALLCNSSGERKLLIDPQCRKLRESVLKYTYKEGTRIPNKDGLYDHLCDGLRYLVHRLFPLKQIPQTGHKTYRRI